jgi:hypothetical protein
VDELKAAFGSGSPRSRAPRTFVVLASITGALVAGLVATAATSDDAALVERHRIAYLRPGAVPYPSDNRHTQEREQLGRVLFFDPRPPATSPSQRNSLVRPNISMNPWARLLAHGSRPART